MGVLARAGVFWYLVHLIEKLGKKRQWKVRWWRGCSPLPLASLILGSIGIVLQSDIVDSL